MERPSDIQRRLRDLRTDEYELSECMIDNQCMVGGCYTTNSPAKCYVRLMRIRFDIAEVNKKIAPDGGVGVLSQNMIDSSKNNPR